MWGFIFGVLGGFIGLVWTLLRPVMDVWGHIWGKKIEDKADAKYKQMLLSLERSSKANALMAELRVTINAHRIGLYEFHNGGVFSNSNPIWRLSCTTEIHGPGVGTTDLTSQPIMASRVIDILNPLLSIIRKPSCATDPCVQCVRAMSTLVVQNMSPSFARTLFENQGVDTAILAAISDPDGRITGFLEVDYCSFGQDGQPVVIGNDVGKIICKYCTQIEFALASVTVPE